MYDFLFACILMLMDSMGCCWVLQVGSYFVGQYYQVLQQQPDRVHQFYADGSTVIWVDGDSSESASEMLVNLSGNCLYKYILYTSFKCFHVLECICGHFR